MPFSPSEIWCGIAVEATRGTAVSPTQFPPVRAPVVTPTLVMLEDKGLRGSMADIYNLVPGTRYDDVSFTGDVFAPSFPMFVRGVLGSADTKTGTTIPFAHKFSLNNTIGADNTMQPPSYTLTLFDGYAYRQFAAAQCDTLTLKYSVASLLEFDTKWVCNPFAFTSAANTVTGARPVPSWDGAISLGGSSTAVIMDGEVGLSRSAKPIFTINGIQAPYRNWAGALACSGKVTVLMENETYMAAYLANTQQSLDLVWTDPNVTTNTVEYHFNQVAFKTGKWNYGQDYISVEVEFVGIPNATDATAGGVSPVAITVNNSVGTAY